VVKVQRTGLLELFKNDLQNLKFAAKVFDKIDPKSDGADRDWVSIYEESAKLLYRCLLFARNFSGFLGVCFLMETSRCCAMC
jgi:hypothetical protein